MFVINASILPLCSSTIPTLVSLRCLFCSFILELGGTVLNIIAVVHSLRAGKMYQIEKEHGKATPTKTSVEVYINVFIILAMTFSILATTTVFSLVVVCERSLEYITGKVDRRHLKAQKQKIGVISTDSIEKFNQQQETYF
ncbi:hypothetical protein I9W82_001616 [Candida metapsilosis]|uniref:Uncharacterized protein n=1 Tax=Candida metapsilosis TaxID=273372 RepID=A0A8H8DDD3_9ASCO|nr:hypothetical protein I9W82_001616 [Candida metapsilosis]